MGTFASLNSNQDVYIVADYIASRSMIDDLSKEIDLGGHIWQGGDRLVGQI